MYTRGTSSLSAWTTAARTEGVSRLPTAVHSWCATDSLTWLFTADISTSRPDMAALPQIKLGRSPGPGDLRPHIVQLTGARDRRCAIRGRKSNALQCRWLPGGTAPVTNSNGIAWGCSRDVVRK